MGNLPLCISRQVQEGVVFGEYPEDGRFTLKPFTESTENLRAGVGVDYMGRWGDSMSVEEGVEAGEEEGDVILGLELEQDSVSQKRVEGVILTVPCQFIIITLQQVS